VLTRPLPRRVRHKELETGLSLALRLANRHGETWKVFTGATGLPISGLRMSECLLELSACSSVPTERIQPWTPIWMGHDVEVFGHRFERSRFLRLNLRICPHCMEEDVSLRAEGESAEDAAYLRLDWCLAFIFGCERHRVRLISRCSKCGGRPKWNVGRIDACHCGASLLTQRPECLSGHELAILSVLRDRLFGREGKDGLLSMTRDVPLPDLVNLLRLLGQVSGSGQRVSDVACALEVENLGDLLVHGACALEELPGSFERVLDLLAADGPGPHRGVTEVYGLPIVRWMRSDRPFIEVLRPIFDSHSATNATISKHKLPGSPPSLYSLEMERKRRFLTVPEMERLIDAVGWAGTYPARRDEVTAAVPDAFLLLNDAAAHIGVPWRCFKQLREAGVISPSWAVSGSAPQRYYRAELDALLERLRADVPQFETAPPLLVTLKQLSKSNSIDWRELIVEMIQGRLACRGLLAGPIGVQALLFHPDDVTSRHRARPIDTITKSTAKDLLGLNEAAWTAINGLMLESTSSPVMTTVSRDAVEEFDAKFISLRRIGTAGCLTTTKARSRLDANHVGSVASGDGFSIYSRASAEAVFPALASWRVRRDGDQPVARVD
jgi:hypothetical protein